MNISDAWIIGYAALLGLIGFIEPCSLGVSYAFLLQVKEVRPERKWGFAGAFLLSRAFLLALVGLLVAFLSQQFRVLQSWTFLLIGSFFILAGILALLQQQMRSVQTGMEWMSKLTQLPGVLGTLMGPMIPVCSIPLLAILLGSNLTLGTIWLGFVSLFVFGAMLSFPLLLLLWWSVSIEWLQRLYAVMQRYRWVTSALLIGLGGLIMVSSRWWQTTLIQ
ncbi:MAG: hypothetical protein HY731_13510 [Candidatus Tectomicrobia bacterium]|nr:hypothetical protein [Candidatus Tectomicrobia bacterium]